ncbi:hypothetical protein B0H14DRAFT_3436678 [Mycena olivaceomarginata]|nr:hypothetical protein B0H14DRAFT_3436678 [Mycena olivaceomarginata]
MTESRDELAAIIDHGNNTGLWTEIRSNGNAEVVKLSAVTVLPDVKTWWDSGFYMLRCLRYLQQDLRTIFGNTSGSQANVAATVAFAPPTEHFPAPPAAQMAASSDTSRSDSAPIDFNALGDLSDTDFFAFLDTINSMPMPAVPQTETDDTFGFFGVGFAYGLIPDASVDMQTDDFAGTTLSLPTLPLPPVSPPTRLLLQPLLQWSRRATGTGSANAKMRSM